MTETDGLVTETRAVAVHRLSIMFYGLAASAAVVGQTWVAVTHIPWPDGLAVGWQIAAASPFALTLELLAVVLSLMADTRLRLGERAAGIRVGSAAVAALATGVIVAGHWPDAYIVAAFGGLSMAAYLLSLAHMATRRRDALRAAGRLDIVTPAYGLGRWARRPRETARAAELARARGLGLHESIEAARAELRAERRRPAIAAAVESAVRAAHSDKRMAEIAVSTLDLDRIARELESTADYAGWAARLAPAVTAPGESGDEPDGESGGDAPLYVPPAWLGDSPAESPTDSPDDAAGESVSQSGDAPAPRQVTHSGESVTQPATHSGESVSQPTTRRGESTGESVRRRGRRVPAELIEHAQAASEDPWVRMAWLWHATDGQVSGRELGRASGRSEATGIRASSQWRHNPPPDPRR